MSKVQQDLASLKQHSSALEAEATHHAEELKATKLMLQDVAVATARQAQQVCCPLLCTASKCLQSIDPQ